MLKCLCLRISQGQGQSNSGATAQSARRGCCYRSLVLVISSSNCLCWLFSPLVCQLQIALIAGSLVLGTAISKAQGARLKILGWPASKSSQLQFWRLVAEFIPGFGVIWLGRIQPAAHSATTSHAFLFYNAWTICMSGKRINTLGKVDYV